eukprot:4797341-Pyramimonas_sp.AAC.1
MWKNVSRLLETIISKQKRPSGASMRNACCNDDLHDDDVDNESGIDDVDTGHLHDGDDGKHGDEHSAECRCHDHGANGDDLTMVQYGKTTLKTAPGDPKRSPSPTSCLEADGGKLPHYFEAQ